MKILRLRFDEVLNNNREIRIISKFAGDLFEVDDIAFSLALLVDVGHDTDEYSIKEEKVEEYLSAVYDHAFGDFLYLGEVFKIIEFDRADVDSVHCLYEFVLKVIEAGVGDEVAVEHREACEENQDQQER
jgi:hypothetical protein